MSFMMPKTPNVVMPPPPKPKHMPDPDDVLKRKRKQQEAARQFQSTTLFDDAQTSETLG